MDPDDYISPNCLAGIYAAFLRFPEAEMLYFNVREVAEDASPDGEWGGGCPHYPGGKTVGRGLRDGQ